MTVQQLRITGYCGGKYYRVAVYLDNKVVWAESLSRCQPVKDLLTKIKKDFKVANRKSLKKEASLLIVKQAVKELRAVLYLDGRYGICPYCDRPIISPGLDQYSCQSNCLILYPGLNLR